jgi:heme o synthase
VTTLKQTTVRETIYTNMGFKLRAYWQLIKSLQTGLLLITGLAGYMSARCPMTSWAAILALTTTLFLAISGSTILNMVYDRDIDSKMKRAAHRPLPSGKIRVEEALLVGLLVSALGVGGAYALSPLYGAVVFAGIFFDVAIYTIWLKRRTPWSIVWGGISGGMPILAGRVLGTEQIEAVGVLLALAILFWIPTHIMTFGIKYVDDYKKANVPTFAGQYGEKTTRLIISVSTTAAVILMSLAILQIEINAHCLYATISMGAILVGTAIFNQLYPSERLNFGLFKFASLYMLGSMGLIILNI